MKNLTIILLLTFSINAYATKWPKPDPKPDWQITNNNKPDIKIHNTAHGGEGGNATAHGGAGGFGVGTAHSNAEGGKVGDISLSGPTIGNQDSNSSSRSSSSSNSSSDNNLQNVGNLTDNSSVDQNQQQSTVIEYPHNLTYTELMQAQHGPQLYSELNGYQDNIDNILTNFVTDQYPSVKNKAVSKCGIIADASSIGLQRFITRLRARHNQYLTPIHVTKELLSMSPEGTKSAISVIHTAYHSRGHNANSGAGEVTNSGVTRQITASLGSATVLPFPHVQVYYCRNKLDVEWPE